MRRRCMGSLHLVAYHVSSSSLHLCQLHYTTVHPPPYTSRLTFATISTTQPGTPFPQWAPWHTNESRDVSGSCPSFTKLKCVLPRNLMHWSYELAALRMTRSSQSRDRHGTWHSPDRVCTYGDSSEMYYINADNQGQRPTRGFVPGEGSSTFERSRTRCNLSTELLLNNMVRYSVPVLSLG
ncbi:uncharacterized protein LY79DRAFT_209934 [Colletotrichum navitas]|uniref:Uncharacterized protein n=1 Tax=Colletotrichum navitas TaxID=681940 RepID=A0AAD8VC47_9PEZI|nr:uncharacterized protein LY79DRAFT_209934 [Colletotrichum navitas]KAK1599150.1 hypothetical protein LY79DRAFT_209934 [Colletotrichum navitas]